MSRQQFFSQMCAQEVQSDNGISREPKNGETYCAELKQNGRRRVKPSSGQNIADCGASVVLGRGFVHKISWSSSRRTRFRNCGLKNSVRRRHSSFWKTSFKTDVCSGSNHPSEAMRWSKEVEMGTSVDDLKTSRSIFGRLFRTSRRLMRRPLLP